MSEIEESAVLLSKIVLLMNKFDFLNTIDESEKEYCAQLRNIALSYADNIRKEFLEKKAAQPETPTPYVDESAFIGLDFLNENHGL